MTHFDEILDRIKKATGTRTQVELANLLGIRQSSISDAKRRGSVPADWYIKLYRSLGLNPEWLSDGMDPMYAKPGMAEAGANYAKEPVASYGRSPSRSRVVQVSNMTGQTTKEGAWQPEYIAQLAIPETYFRPALIVVKAEDAGMEPNIHKGAFIGLDTEQKRVLSGEIYGIYVPNEGLAIRRVLYDAQQEVFVLRGDNPDLPDQNLTPETKDKLLLGRVIWVMQEL
jgi:hypothetical protein